MTVLFWTIAVGPVAQTVFAPGRTLIPFPSAPTQAAFVWMGRLTLALVLASSIAAIALALTSARLRALPRHAGFQVAALGGVVLAMWLSAFFGAHRYIRDTLLIMPLVFGAIALNGREHALTAVKVMKQILHVYVLGSLMAWIVVPTWAHTDPGSLHLGFMRLQGITRGPNILGPLALLSLVLAWGFPNRGRWQWVHGGAALAVLFMTQSKTAWMAALFAFAVYAYYRRGSVRGLAAFSSFGVGASVLAFGILRPHPSWHALLSLTGRTRVWSITLQEFMKYPVTGYGLSIWDLSFRDRHPGLSWAGNAHDQLLQLLGSSGVIGGIAYIGYAVAVLVAARDSGSRTRGASWALAGLLLIQGVTETPLRNLGVDGTLLFHVIVFASLLIGVSGAEPATLPVKDRSRPISSTSAAGHEIGVVRPGVTACASRDAQGRER